MTEAEKALLEGNTSESLEARKFADWDYAWKDQSPLNQSSLNLVWGTAHKYISDRYGALADVYPSTKQIAKQLMLPTAHAVWKKRMQDKKFPRVTPLEQRWRKPCPSCAFQEVLEKPSKACAAPDCQKHAPEEAPPPEHVRVCNPATGCHMVSGPALQKRDALKDQVLKGQEAGIADPLGVYDELGDHLQPAAMVLGARHEDHSYGENWGEPISDFLMGNWDGQSGRLANKHDTKPAEKDLPVKFPRYFPHTKGVWSGTKEDEEGGDDEDEDEEEEAEE